MTKDEKYLIALYETALEEGNLYQPLNRYEIGEKIGLQRKAVETICRLLLQANFLKKVDEELVSLTDHGKSLALTLLSQ